MCSKTTSRQLERDMYWYQLINNPGLFDINTPSSISRPYWCEIPIRGVLTAQLCPKCPQALCLVCVPFLHCHEISPPLNLNSGTSKRGLPEILTP